MIKKMTWGELMSKWGDTGRVFENFDALSDKITEVDTLFTTKYGYCNLASLYNEVMIMLGNTVDESPWKDLKIYISSFKENDLRFIQLIIQKCLEYTAFYKKVLTDNGVKRALSYHKEYLNNSNASSTERGTNSDTPQNSNLYDSEHPESDALFDQAIADYASAINKNKASSESQNVGSSETNVSGSTWDEQRKNLDLLFYNELKDYLMSIPERIYSYYSIDTIPVPELTKYFIGYLKNVKEMFESDE